MKSRCLACFALWSGLLSSAVSPVSAADPHLHGQAALEVSLEAGQVLVTLRGPAQVFLGFEHAPETAEEVAAVAHARSVLEAPDRLFSFAGADCDVEEIVLQMPFPVEEHTGQGDGLEHESHGGEPMHHDDDQAHAAHGESTHVDITVDYRLACVRGMPVALTANLFSEFSELEAIEAVWIDEAGGGSEELTPRAAILSFSQ